MEYFVITKTKPGNVFFKLSPINNTDQSRIIKLTKQMPTTRLPKEWALGVFLDDAVFKMYQKGFFSFGDKTAEIKKLAIDEQVYFGPEEELESIKDNSTDAIDKMLAVLKGGKRTEIIDLIQKDANSVVLLAREHMDELTTGVVDLIEKQAKVQLRIDE